MDVNEYFIEIELQNLNEVCICYIPIFMSVLGFKCKLKSYILIYLQGSFLILTVLFI